MKLGTMELTSLNYAIVYVILLCALAQGGSEGKEEEVSRDGGALSPLSFYIHGIQVEDVRKQCRKELIERNNDIKDFDLQPHAIENNIHKATKSLPLHMKRELLDCIRTSTTPPAPVSIQKASTRYLLAKQNRATFGVKSGHRRTLVADSPHNQISPNRGPTPASSPPSPTPSPPDDENLPLPPDMFAPFPPPPPLPHPPPRAFKPIEYAPDAPPPSDDNNKKQRLILAGSICGIIILIGMALCCREIKKGKVDNDSPFLVLTSSDYPGGSQKVVRLGEDEKYESDINSGKNPSNIRNGSIRVGDIKNASMVETSIESVGQGPAPTNGKLPPTPTPPPPPPLSAPPPPAPPRPHPRAPPPPPPKGANPPPAPPKPVRLKEGERSSESDAAKPKLKPFFWDKVNAKPGQNMVWHEISSGSFVINEEMMESLFGCANNRERNKNAPSVDTTVHYIQIIDPKKAQNLSILLRALNVTTAEVLDALKEGNEIPVELIQTLLKMAPTTEEEIKLRLFQGELSELGPAERFLKVLVDIPFAFKRLESLMFMSILQEEFSNIKDSFATLEVACNELRKSRLFMKLLEAVLKTGNRMNDGTYRGGAQAFRLDTLLKLSDVKGTDGKTTLLHFVVVEIIRSEGIRAVRTERESRSVSSMDTNNDYDESNEETEERYRSLGLQVISSLSTELEDVKKAALIDGDALTSTVLKLGQSMVKAEEFLNKEMKSLEEESEFQHCMERFVVKAREDVTCLVEEEKRIMALVKSTADYFHGNAGKDEGLRLFLIVRDFLIILDKVCKEVRDSTMKGPKVPSIINNKKEHPSSPAASSPDTRQQSSSPSPRPSDLHRRLFPAIAERRILDDSSDDDDDY